MQVLIAAAAGIAGFLYFSTIRGYPFQLAMLMGAAMMFLGWAGARTWKGLRGLARRDSDDPPG
jgi:hypothetical protein